MIKEIIGTMKSSSPISFHVTINLFVPDTDNVTCFIQNHNNLVTNFVQNKYKRKKNIYKVKKKKSKTINKEYNI